MSKRLLRITFMVILLAGVLAACGGAQATSTPASGAGGGLAGEPVLIGVALAQTGNVALLGQDQVIGVQIAEKFFNDRGGVNGRPIKLVIQDTAGDEAGAIQ